MLHDLLLLTVTVCNHYDWRVTTVAIFGITGATIYGVARAYYRSQKTEIIEEIIDDPHQ